MILTDNGKILISADGKVYKSSSSSGSGSGGITPTGTLEITENGEHDVTNYAKANVNIPTPSGTVEINSNGLHNVKMYESANINVPIPEGYIKPSGILTIDTNGNHNVREYEEVNVSIASSGEDSGEDSVSYYKTHRNKNYPYFPLPSEMTDTQDTIYMLYSASGYMCCPVFNITFTECACTIQKYNNTTLVSEYAESVTSGTTKYLQFSEEDSDYSTYNYIVIKLQGNITKHYLNFSPQFNGETYYSYSSGDLIEVSGKCNSCDIKVSSGDRYHQNLEYYSFLGKDLKTNMSGMFYNCYSLQTIPQLDTSNVTNMSSMFHSCYSLQTIPQLDTSNVTNMSSMFHSCASLQTIPQLNTSNVTDMSGMSSMFYNCYSLRTIPQLETSKVSSMSSIFYNCYSLQTIPQLDTSNVTSMYSMFYNCYSLQTIPQLNTSNVTSMYSMFSGCYSLQTIPQLDTSNVTNMSSMFSNCRLLYKINMENIKLSFDLSHSTILPTTELVKLLNNLATVTTTQTLKLGSTLLAKLTDEEKAIPK